MTILQVHVLSILALTINAIVFMLSILAIRIDFIVRNILYILSIGLTIIFHLYTLFRCQ